MERQSVAQVLLLDYAWPINIDEKILNENGNTWMINTDLPCCTTSFFET